MVAAGIAEDRDDGPVGSGAEPSYRTSEVPIESGESRAGAGLPADRFRFVREIGVGAYGRVEEAWDEALGQAVAIKRLRPERVTPTATERFLREARIAREVQHPNLVRIFEVGGTVDEVWLVLELLEGGSLRERLRRPMPLPEAIAITCGVLEGLAALHGAGLVHRDVKPENILFDAAGQVKLCDFGIARRLGDEETRLTATGGLVGTVAYMAPEQALDRNVDERADLYAVGVVLFEMLTGKLPFAAQSDVGQLAGRFEGRVRDPRSLRPETPTWLAQVVLALVARDPGRRPASAAAVLGLLRRAKAPRRGSKGRRLVAAAVVAAGCAGTWLLGRGSDAGGELGLTRIPEIPLSWQVLDSDGRQLFQVDGGEARIARLEPGGPKKVLLVPYSREQPAVPRVLEVYGSDGRRERVVDLPDHSSLFPDWPATYGPEIYAMDVDGDGGEEVFVAFQHTPNWPSYTLLWEPRLDRVRLVFVGSGHHRPLAVFDQDGDGHNEIVFGGGNNLVGHGASFAGVALIPPVGGLAQGNEGGSAATPDTYRVNTNGGLRWYFVTRHGFPAYQRSARVDHERRRLEISMTEGLEPVRLSFDGFEVSGEASGRPLELRQRARQRAWEAIERGLRARRAAGDPTTLQEAFGAARAAAVEAGDLFLAEWATRQEAGALVALGRLEAGGALWESLGADRADVALDAGRAFHQAGALEEAGRWFDRGARAGASGSHSAFVAPLLEAQLLLDLERGRLAERSEGLFRNFLGLYGTSPAALDQVALLKAFVDTWLGRPSPPEMLATLLPWVQDHRHKVWLGEAYVLAGDRAGARALVDQLDRGGWKGRAAVELLRAEVLAAEGLGDAAREAAAAAHRAMVAAEPDDLVLRAHRRRHGQRLDVLAQQLGGFDGFQASIGDQPVFSDQQLGGFGAQ